VPSDYPIAFGITQRLCYTFLQCPAAVNSFLQHFVADIGKKKQSLSIFLESASLHFLIEKIKGKQEKFNILSGSSPETDLSSSLTPC
jgi:hypothetical protein